jgi:hypothetical protein
MYPVSMNKPFVSFKNRPVMPKYFRNTESYDLGRDILEFAAEGVRVTANNPLMRRDNPEAVDKINIFKALSKSNNEFDVEAVETLGDALYQAVRGYTL